MKLKKKMIKFGSLSGLFIITIGISLSKNMTISGQSRQDSVGKQLYSQSFYQTNQAATVAHLDQLAKEKLLEEERLAEEKRQEERLAQQQAKLDLESSFYENVITVSNGDSKLVLVNKNYALDSSYAPSDLVLPNVLALGHEQNKTIYDSLIKDLENYESVKMKTRFGYTNVDKGIVSKFLSGFNLPIQNIFVQTNIITSFINGGYKGDELLKWDICFVSGKSAQKVEVNEEIINKSN